jgi:hypothetical protein
MQSPTGFRMFQENATPWATAYKEYYSNTPILAPPLLSGHYADDDEFWAQNISLFGTADYSAVANEHTNWPSYENFYSTLETRAPWMSGPCIQAQPSDSFGNTSHEIEQIPTFPPSIITLHQGDINPINESIEPLNLYVKSDSPDIGSFYLVETASDTAFAGQPPNEAPGSAFSQLSQVRARRLENSVLYSPFNRYSSNESPEGERGSDEWKGSTKSSNPRVTERGTHELGNIGWSARKLYVCSHILPNGKPCTSRFRQSEHLQRHLKAHSGKKPFRCEICDRGFGRRDNCHVHYFTHLKQATTKGAKFRNAKFSLEQLVTKVGDKEVIRKLQERVKKQTLRQ